MWNARLRLGVNLAPDTAKRLAQERIFKLLASDHDNEYMMIDATIVRAHQHSAGARKKTDSEVNPVRTRCQRISDTFEKPEMATDLFEHDLHKLNILRQRGSESFASRELKLKEFLQ